MPDEDDNVTDEERRLAERGEELVVAAVSQTYAPQSLREAIERERERAGRRSVPFWRRRRWIAASAVAVAAVAAVAVGVGLQSDSGTEAPTLTMVQAAAGGQPTDPAPATRGGDPPTLAAKVGSLEFPDWRQSFGWRAVGRREDELAGRSVTTVYYRNADGARLGYSVVDGVPLDETPPGRDVTRAGNSYHVARAGGRTLVTWTQQGHTCVIVASAAVPDGRLVALAASRNS